MSQIKIGKGPETPSFKCTETKFFPPSVKTAHRLLYHYIIDTGRIDLFPRQIRCFGILELVATNLQNSQELAGYLFTVIDCAFAALSIRVKYVYIHYLLY